MNIRIKMKATGEKKESEATLQRITKNIGWLFFDKIIRMALGLFVGIWIARYLGPKDFGLYEFSAVLISIFGAAAGLGLQGIVVRDLARDARTWRATLGTAAVLQTIGGLLAYGLIILTIHILHRDDPIVKTLVAILGLSVILKASEISAYWFESQTGSKPIVIAQNASLMIFSIIKIILIVSSADLITFAYAAAIESIAASFLILLTLKIRGPGLKGLKFSTLKAKHLLRESWPLLLSSLSISVYMKIDQLMLGYMLNPEAVGIYSAAVRLSEGWYFIPTMIVASAFPTLTKIKVSNNEKYLEQLQRLYSVMIWLAIFIAIPITMYSGEIVKVFYGESFMPSSTVLTIHIWSAIFVFIGIVSNRYVIEESKQKILFYLTLIGALLNIILNLILIPPLDAKGAALATLISYFAVNYLALWLVKDLKILAIMTTRSFTCELYLMQLKQYISRRIWKDKT